MTTNKKEDKKNIFQRVNSVMSEINYIKKDLEINFGVKFKAVSHDKVISSVRKHLISNGIVITTKQNQLENCFFQYGDDSRKKTIYRAIYEISFVNIDNSEDRIVTQIESHSMLIDDKSPGKATSYAVKIAILKLFCLETGEDDESPHSDSTGLSNLPKTVSPEQAKEIEIKANKLGKASQVLTSAGVDDFSFIPENKYDFFVKHLNEQINQKEPKKNEGI